MEYTKEPLSTTQVTVMENENDNIQMECPIFIIFAEYFGYVSKFIKFAEDWCNGKVPEIHVQKFLMIEATSIKRKMMQDFTIDDIKYYYKRYYPLVLEEFCQKLSNIIEKDNNN